MIKSADAFRTISEVADDLELPQHVLRFWETRFPQIKPLKRAGGRRFYRPADVRLLTAIRQLLYGEGYTIKGVQRLLKEQGARGLQGGATPPVFDRPEEMQSGVDAIPVEQDPAGAGAADEPELASSQQAPQEAGAGRLGLAERQLLESALAIIADCQGILRSVGAIGSADC